MAKAYDIVFVGNYTKDTTVTSEGVRVVDGGGFNYGAQAAIRMGLRVAAVTRLAQEDWHVVDGLRSLGIDTYATATPESTRLRLEYPTKNPDERIIYVASSAGSFAADQVDSLETRAFAVNPSFRGEVSPAFLESLRRPGVVLALDVQGFVRVARAGRLEYESWPEQEAVLSGVGLVKTDAVEAEQLTGHSDRRAAALALAGLGPSEVVLTHRDGLLVYAFGSYFEAGFFPRKLVGRSGRGDTCLASYLAARLTASPEQATLWSAALTSLKMEGDGPFRGTVADVQDLIDRRYRHQA